MARKATAQVVLPDEQSPADLIDAALAEVGDSSEGLTFDAALADSRDTGTLIDPTAVLGGNQRIVNDQEKDTLIGVPLVILGYRFNQGDQGPFVSVDAVTARNERVIVNDGGTGIYAQCKLLEDAGMLERIVIRRGLRRSDFKYDEESKRAVKADDPPEVHARAKAASTYYFDNSR